MNDSKWLSVSLPYVLPRPPGGGDAWADDAARQGGRGSQRLLEVTEVPALDDVAEALGVAPGDPVVLRRRLILLDDRPVELADSYYPVSIARGTPLAEARKIRGGAVTLLAELGYRPGQVREDVHTRVPDAAEREALRLEQGEWVLCLTRLLSTSAGMPVEASMMRMVPHGRRLRYELSVD